jgi:hypothetical protein
MLMDKLLNAAKIHKQEVVPDPVADKQGANTVAAAPKRAKGDEPIDYEGEAMDAQEPADEGEAESPEEEKAEGPEEYEIKCWADKLMEAEQIKADPEKMKYVEPELAERKKALDKIAPVKSIADIRKRESAME